MIEKWLEVLDDGGETGAVLRDLFKTFDRIKQNLLIVNYLMCSVEKSSINIIHFYLSKRKRRTKTESSFSPC